MSAPKFAVGDVVWSKARKKQLAVESPALYVKPGEKAVKSLDGVIGKSVGGWWYRFDNFEEGYISHERNLCPIPDASEWSFTDLMEEIKSGSGVDA